MKDDTNRPGWAGFFLLAFGVMMGASSVLLIKASSMPAALLASARLLAAALIVAPLWRRERRQSVQPESVVGAVRTATLPGLFMALHLISWNVGARGTLAGNATLLVNMIPLVMPMLAWGLLREKLRGRELAGTGVALAGVAVLGFSDYRFAPEHLAGDAVCFGSMVLYAVYLILARKRVKPGELFTYLAPLYGVAGAFCLVWALIFELPFPQPTAVDLWLIAGLVLGPTLAGHSITNWAMTRFPAQTVSLVNVNQFVFAGLMSFLAFGEVPKPLFFVTAVLVIAGAWLALARRRSRATVTLRSLP